MWRFLIRIYSQGMVASGDMERNQFIDMVTIFLSNLVKESQEYHTEVRQELTGGIN